VLKRLVRRNPFIASERRNKTFPVAGICFLRRMFFRVFDDSKTQLCFLFSGPDNCLPTS